ncbi:MAG: DUF4097 family beta strand repeat-containing protein [Balneolales bacterium]|nr:DUF4097 family beta strand repeat-containing protein [Balneolales bacterium]
MKSKFSWELVLVGGLIIIVAVMLNRNEPTPTGLESILTEEEAPIAESRESAPEIPEPVKPDNTAEEITNSSTDDELTDSDVTLAEPTVAVTEQENHIAAAAEPGQPETQSNQSEAQSGQTETPASNPDSRKTNDREREILASTTRMLGNVLDGTSALTDEISGDSPFNKRYNEDVATLYQEQRFPAFALGRITTNLESGHVQLLTHDSSDILVQIWLPENVSESDFNKSHVAVLSKNPESLTIKVEKKPVADDWYSRIKSWWSSTGNGFQPGVRIVVPEGALTHIIETRAGNIEAYNAGGDIQIETRAGNLSLTGLYGNITADTRAGNIRSSGLSGNTTLRTRAGNIVAENHDANAELLTRAGNITVETQTTNRSMNLESRVGNITVRIPASTNADINLNGTQVSVSDLFETSGEIESQYIRGVLNSGGASLKAHTRLGSVSIQPID